MLNYKSCQQDSNYGPSNHWATLPTVIYKEITCKIFKIKLEIIGLISYYHYIEVPLCVKSKALNVSNLKHHEILCQVENH